MSELEDPRHEHPYGTWGQWVERVDNAKEVSVSVNGEDYDEDHPWVVEHFGRLPDEYTPAMEVEIEEVQRDIAERKA